MSSSPDRTIRVPYNRAIDREDIRPSIVATLHQLLELLTKADVITGRYALEHTKSSAEAYAQEVTQTPRGMLVLRESFQKFKERVRKNQKQKSVWEVTRWSVHDCAQFEARVDKIRKLLDGLESITHALGVLEKQRERLLEEIDSVSDAQSLSLLQEVGSSESAPAALRAVSDTASIRLTMLSGDSQSYYTAKTGQTDSIHKILSFRQKKLAPKALWEGDMYVNHPQKDISVGEANDKGQTSGGLPVPETTHVAPKDEPIDNDRSVPQHQRWMSALLARRSNAQHAPVFSPNDIHYGRAIDPFKASDDQEYRKISGKLAVKAHEGFHLAQRVFIELRNIHRAAISFISVVPIDDALDKLLACIEGPPGTPYEGGVFWITIRITNFQPPAMRFHTRIYHPNIDHTGKICADYGDWWEKTMVLNKKSSECSLGRELPWFSEHATNHYSLGALLVALCGLLANPNIEDPLVPEIAEKFVTDYDEYCSAARLYTQRYAGATRPIEKELDFSHEPHAAEGDTVYEAPDFDLKAKTVTSSIGPVNTVGADWKGSGFVEQEAMGEAKNMNRIFPGYNEDGDEKVGFELWF